MKKTLVKKNLLKGTLNSKSPKIGRVPIEPQRFTLLRAALTTELRKIPSIMSTCAKLPAPSSPSFPRVLDRPQHQPPPGFQLSLRVSCPTLQKNCQVCRCDIMFVKGLLQGFRVLKYRNPSEIGCDSLGCGVTNM